MIGDFGAVLIQCRDHSGVFGDVEPGLALASHWVAFREDRLREAEVGSNKQIGEEVKLLDRVKICVIGETNRRPCTSRIRLKPDAVRQGRQSVASNR